jgi:hypothetical protein
MEHGSTPPPQANATQEASSGAASALPLNVEDCQALLRAQAATIAAQDAKLEEFAAEMSKLRKLLSYFVNSHRSEKRILPAENQSLLPFESSEEFQVAVHGTSP